MIPAERTAKIAELRAEIDRLERGWPEKVEAMMVFRDRYGRAYITAFPGGDGRLVLVSLDGKSAGCMNGTKAGFDGFGSEGVAGFAYLGRARDLLAIKTPDAHEPTGAELVGKVCEFSDDGLEWESPCKCDGFDPKRGYTWGSCLAYFKTARLYRNDPPRHPPAGGDAVTLLQRGPDGLQGYGDAVKECPRFSDGEIVAMQERIKAGADVKPFNMLCASIPSKAQRAAENFRASAIADAISGTGEVS